MIDRRDMLALSVLSVLVPGGGGGRAKAEAGTPDMTTRPLHGRNLTVLDLTHKLTRAFAFTPDRLSVQAVDGSGKAAGMALNRISFVEHTGTHLDAPRHFAPEGASVGDLPVSELIGPLVVIDISAKVKADRGARIMPDDVADWERQYGPIPADACVAMSSGWDPLAELRRFGSLPPTERRKSPGFSTEVLPLLIARGVRGIGVDTLSLDAGESMPAFPVHQAWLRSGRWGLEALANLNRAPPSGGLVFVGVPPIEAATGMPARVVALF